MIRFRTIIFLFFLFVVQISVAQQIAVPALNNRRVHDDAGVLSSSTVNYLEHRLQVFEDSTSNQIVVLTIPTLSNDAIESFGIRAAKEWKLGTAGKDNGVIIIVAVNDHKMRIEVGHGLEGPLPDAMTNRIIQNEMRPAFRRNDYDAGMIAAVDGVIAATKGEYKGEGLRSGRRGNGKSGIPVWLIIFIVLGIISMFSKKNGGGRTGGWSSGGGFFLGGMMGGGGRGWSGGGGGGGFSGGGGSFGGGGSSGSW